MTIPVLFFAAIRCVFPAGTADNPSAVAPLEMSGEPVAFWWDAQAFHIGEKAYSWKELKVEPKDGASFKIDLGFDAQRKKNTLDGRIKLGASRYRVGSFGLVGNTPVSNVTEVVAAKGGKISSRLYASGMTLDYMNLPKSANAAKGETVKLVTVGKGSSSGSFSYLLFDPGLELLYNCTGDYHDPALKFDFKYIWTEPEKMLMHVRTGGWVDDSGYTLRVSMKDYVSDTLGSWQKTIALDAMWGEKDYVVDVSDLPSGFYWAHFDYLDRDGKVVHSDYAAYMKPDAKMPWDGTTLGMEDTVPPPWTKPEFAEDGVFKCWNRTIRLGGKGLVSSIVNGGRELLASPVALVADGRELPFDVTLAEKKNSEATYRLVSPGSGVEAKVTCEFDGYMVFEVTYPADIASLKWKVSVDRSCVTGFDDCTSELNDRAIFRKGTNPGWSYNPSLRPMWWMPGKVGIMGGTPSLRGWHVRVIDKAGQVSSDEKTISAVTTFVDERPKAGARRTIKFYLEPTPVKRKDLTFACVDPVKLVTWTGHLGKYFEIKYPGFENPILYKQFADELKKGKRVLFYNASNGICPVDPFWAWYRRDWTQKTIDYFAHEAPNFNYSRFKYAGWGYSCPCSRSHLEYKLWGINWYFNNPIPEAKDLYFDLANAHQCNNAEHGCRWKDDFGREMRDWDIFPRRELHKRAYRLVKAKNSDGIMDGHISCTRCPADVFFDLIRAGEHFAMPVQKNNYTYYDIYTPEVMQSFFVPRSQEYVMSTPPQLLRSRELFDPIGFANYHWRDNLPAIRHCAAYIKIHDLRLNRLPDNREGPQFYQVESASCALGDKRKHEAYYTDGDKSVTLSAPGPRFLWAWFTGNGKGFLILLNDTDSEVDQTVSVKGLAANGKELLDGGKFDFTSGSCKIKFPPRDARFITFDLNGSRGK